MLDLYKVPIIVFRPLYGLRSSNDLQATDHAFQMDRKLVQPVHSMQDVFAFVRERGALKYKIMSLQQSIGGLMKQTTKFYVFVRGYV